MQPSNVPAVGRAGEHLSSTPHAPSSRAQSGRSYMHDPYRAASLVVPQGAPTSGGGAMLSVRLSVGSMGTPYLRNLGHDGSNQQLRSSISSTAPSSQRPSSSFGNSSLPPDGSLPDMNGSVLPPTRSVLKALAKQCRPRPPWCVGTLNTPTLEGEILHFATFMYPTAKDAAERDASLLIAHKVAQDVWPGSQLQPLGATAAGQAPTPEAVMHFYVAGSDVPVADLEKELILAANRHGAQVHLGEDYRGCPCVLLTDIFHGLRTTLRYGPTADAAGAAAAVLRDRIAGNASANAVLVVLLAVVRQMRILNETGMQLDMLSDEALSIMLLAVMNSYSGGTHPDAGTLLTDFFLTYGFESNFNPAEHAVTLQGIVEQTPTRSTESRLAVMDPYDGTINLAAKFEGSQSLQDTFNYCYNAISQYLHLTTNQRRAQSALSNILGGEPFWGRVLSYYQQHIEPYFSIVQSKLPALLRRGVI